MSDSYKSKADNSMKTDVLYKYAKSAGIVVALFFFMNQVLGWFDGFIKTDVIGQYGDFVGGVIGTILSVVLLSETFNSQIEESKKNATVFETQQLNELVFHLLNQYNAIVDSFRIEGKGEGGEDGETIIYSGKEGLHFLVVKMQEDFEFSDSYSRKAAISQYQSFYDANVDFAPIYFRTIYRIFDVIDNAPVSENIKVKYAKLIRCQLTDSELFLIRYNAMGQLGKNMRPLINKYNLLKHIHPLSLLEYRKWRNSFPESSRNKANIILYMIQKQIHDLFLCEDNTRAITSTRARYNVNVSKQNNATVCKLDFTRNTKVCISYDVFTCLDSIPMETIRLLLIDWLKDVFVFFNFGIYNGRIDVESSATERNENKEHFSIAITRKDNKEIVITQKNNEKETSSSKDKQS